MSAIESALGTTMGLMGAGVEVMGAGMVLGAVNRMSRQAQQTVAPRRRPASAYQPRRVRIRYRHPAPVPRVVRMKQARPVVEPARRPLRPMRRRFLGF